LPLIKLNESSNTTEKNACIASKVKLYARVSSSEQRIIDTDNEPIEVSVGK
jgi:predicted site-specific integrase-resolvase